MKIVVVEDDKKLSGALKVALEKEGYAVDVFNDGELAERRIDLNNTSYDLIILDWMLPGKDGMAICAHLREKGIKVPILMLTGKDAVEDKVGALDKGVDDYLTKPFSISELVARVRALMRRPREAQTADNIMRVKDLTLNLTTRKVYRGDTEIPLTLKEFGVLEYLMRHPNQVINRDQILDHVWDFNFNSLSNIVDVHINNLRKKIHNDVETYLETVRGVGYRFKA